MQMKIKFYLLRYRPVLTWPRKQLIHYLPLFNYAKIPRYQCLTAIQAAINGCCMFSQAVLSCLTDNQRAVFDCQLSMTRARGHPLFSYSWLSYWHVTIYVEKAQGVFLQEQARQQAS